MKIRISKQNVLLALSTTLLFACGGGGKDTATSVAPTPTPIPMVTKVYAYSGSQYTNKIFGFSMDQTSGALTATAQASITANAFPFSIAVSRNNNYLFSMNYSSHTLASYSINPNTGELTLADSKDLGAGTAPAWVSTNPKADVVYVANSGTGRIAVYDYNNTTGALTARTTVNAGSGVTAIAINKAATMLYTSDQNVDQIGIYTLDASGLPTYVSSVQMTSGSQTNAVQLSPDGRFLYSANWGGKTVSAFAVSGTTLTQIGSDLSVGAVSSGGSYFIQVSPDGQRLYSTQPYGNSITTFDLNQATGAPSNALQESISGGVNIHFYKSFSFIIRWGNGSTPYPIATRAYSSSTGVGTSDLSSTSGLTGLYQMAIVEVQVPAN